MVNAWAMRPLPIVNTTPESTAVGYAGNNVANDYAGIVWKSAAGAASVQIIVDLGSAQAVDAALFFGCTGALSSWLLNVAALNNDLSVAWSLPATVAFLGGAEMPSHGRGVGYWEATPTDLPPAKRYYRFTFANLAGAAVTIARIAVGKKLVLARNFAFGAGFGLRDLGSVDFSRAGVLLRRRAAKLRTIGLSFPSVHRDEVEAKVQPLVELVAGQEAIVIVTDPEPDAMRQRRCYIGMMIGELGTVWRTANAFEWRANLIDLIPIPRAS